MNSKPMIRWTVRILLLAAAAHLAGCANDPRYKMGVQWFQETEAEKKALTAQGFNQYTGDN